MKNFGKFNRYTRHLNKRALQKKLFAKGKNSFDNHINNINLNDISTENFLPVKDNYGVISGFKKPNFFNVRFKTKEIVCQISKKLTNVLKNQLVIGDKVNLNKDYEICGCLPRKTILARLRGDNTRTSLFQKNIHLIAANIEIAIIVSSVADPPFVPGIIDRYLILCQYGNIKPLICLNKCDLPALPHPIIKYYKEILGIKVVQTSINDKSSIQNLKSSIKNKLVAFIGTSGVGKSSLIKALSGKNLKTQSVSYRNRKGKHTTTNSTLYNIFSNTYVIDTPGIRNLDVGNISLKEIKLYFPEFKELEPKCKYKNCLHYNEPNCAVRDMQNNNNMYRMRYQSYLRILNSTV